MADIPRTDRRHTSIGKIVAITGGILSILTTLIIGFFALSEQIATQTEEKVRQRMEMEAKINTEIAARVALENTLAIKFGIIDEKMKSTDDRVRILERREARRTD